MSGFFPSSFSSSFLLCCWTLNLSYFSGAHLFVNCVCLLVNSTDLLIHSLCLRYSVSNFFLSLCMSSVWLYVCACVRCSCTVVYFTVFCEQRHLLYEQFELHWILWCGTHSSYAFCSRTHTHTHKTHNSRIPIHASLSVCALSCISFDFSLIQSTLLSKTHHIVRWTTRYS